MAKRKDWMHKQKGKRASQLAALLYLIRYTTPEQVIYSTNRGNCPHDDKEDVLHPFILQIWNIWMDQHRCRKTRWCDWTEWCVWCAQMLRRFLEIDGEITVEKIVRAVEYYVSADQKLFLQFGQDDEHDLYPLTDSDWKRMGNGAIASFLNEWMLNQKNMRQNIYQFTRKPFGRELPKEDPRRTLVYSTVGYLDSRESALRSAFDDLQISFRMRKLQAAEEGTEAAEALVNGPHGYQIPYPILLNMEFIAQTRMKDTGSCHLIFKLISQREIVQKDGSRNSSDEAVSKACAAYVAVLEEIAQWEKPAVAGDAAMAQKYVIGSLMAKEIEEAYRLHFISAMVSAKKRKGSQKDRMKLESEIAQYLLGRSAEAEMHDPMTYTEDIKCICSAEEETYMHYISKNILMRRERTILFELLNGLFPQEYRPKWADDDYQKAAAFFSKRYNIIKKLLGIRFPETIYAEAAMNGKRSRKGKNHYDRMLEYYEMIIGWRRQEDVCFLTPIDTYCQVVGKKRRRK